MPTSTSPSRQLTASPRSTVPAAAWLCLTAVLAALGPAALLWLAGFGQAPPDRLPLLAIALLGAVFVGPASDALARVRTGSGPVLALAAVCAVAAWLALAATRAAEPAHLLSPAVALLGTALLARFGSRPGLYPAATVYVACTLLANYTLDSFLPIGDFLLVNVGTLFFGVTFTQRDRVHRYGRRTVYQLIAVAAVANVVLGTALGTPLRFVAVSFLSIILAETADTEVFQRLKDRRWITRVATSNAVSAPIDTVVFTLLAFGGEQFATTQWLAQVIVTDVLVKYASGLAAALGMLALVRSVLAPPLPAGQPAEGA